MTRAQSVEKPICQSFRTTNAVIDTMFLCFHSTDPINLGLPLASKRSAYLDLDKSSDIYLDL